MRTLKSRTFYSVPAAAAPSGFAATILSTLAATAMVSSLIACAAPARAQEDPSAQDRANATAPALEERVRQAALRQLGAQYPESARRFEVRVDQVEPPAGRSDTLRVALRGGRRIPRSHHQVDLEVRTASGSWRRTGWALLDVALYDSVVVAREDLSSGETLSEAQTESAWMDVTDLRGLPMTTAGLRQARSSARTVLTRPVRQGEVLRADDLRGSYAADVGDPLLLRYERGPVRARLDCKAREPGSQGEVIRVYCASTRSMYRARLTEAGRARWLTTIR